MAFDDHDLLFRKPHLILASIFNLFLKLTVIEFLLSSEVLIPDLVSVITVESPAFIKTPGFII